MNKGSLILIYLSVICCTNGFAQTESVQDESGLLIGFRYEVITNLSKNFIINNIRTVLSNEDELKSIREVTHLSVFSTVIESKDEQFTAFILTYPMLPSMKDSLRIVRIKKEYYAKYPVNYPDTTYYPSLHHWGNIKSHLIYSLKIDAKEPINIHDYVEYYSHKKAKKMFNVDSLITYPIYFDMDYIYKDKYTKCQTWVLQKNNIGFITIIGLFTDKGVKKKDYYLKLLQKSIRFKEE